MLITGSRLAEVARVTRAAVTQAYKAATLTREDSGLYDSDSPSVRGWVTVQAVRQGLDPTALLRELDAPPEPRSPIKPKDPADHAPWQRQTVDPNREVSYLEIRADFDDGRGYTSVIRYRFNAADLELDTTVYAVPRPVRVNFDEDDPRVFDAASGVELPAASVAKGKGFELAQVVRA